MALPTGTNRCRAACANRCSPQKLSPTVQQSSPASSSHIPGGVSPSAAGPAAENAVHSIATQQLIEKSETARCRSRSAHSRVPPHPTPRRTSAIRAPSQAESTQTGCKPPQSVKRSNSGKYAKPRLYPPVCKRVAEAAHHIEQNQRRRSMPQSPLQRSPGTPRARSASPQETPDGHPAGGQPCALLPACKSSASASFPYPSSALRAPHPKGVTPSRPPRAARGSKFCTPCRPPPG